MDDQQLLQDYAATRSSRAFTQLVERHVDLVYSAALRRTRGDPHRAAEVTQMVFIDLARKAAQLTRHPLLVGWLHGSTCWAAANLWRAERRRAIHEQAAGVEAEVTGAGASPDWELVRPLLDEALDSLREPDRLAVLLRFFNNLSFAEVAARLGTTENAARMRVDRALEKLHRILQRKGVKSGTAALAAILAQNAVSAAPAGLAGSLASASLAAGSTAATGNILLTALMNKFAYAALGVLAVALSAGLWQQSQAKTTEADALAQVSRILKRRQADLQGLSARVARHRAELAPDTQPSPAPAPVEVERKRLDLVIRRGELDAQYAAVFRRLGLEPDKLNALKTLLVERAQATYDALQLAKQEGAEPATYAESEELTRVAIAPIDAKIAGVIGPEKLAEFQRSIRPYNQVPPSEAGDPARWTRADALGDLFARTSGEYQEAAFALNTLPPPLPDAFVRQARALMTPDEHRRLLAAQETALVLRWMDEIARAAAHEGRLKLAKGSARDYGAPK